MSSNTPKKPKTEYLIEEDFDTTDVSAIPLNREIKHCSSDEEYEEGYIFDNEY